MRVLIRNTALNGQPLEGDGEIFTGATVTDVVLAMKGATLFSDQRDLEDYIDMVLRQRQDAVRVEPRSGGYAAAARPPSPSQLS